MIARLQRWCAYLFLVCAGTLAAALAIIRFTAWLGLPPPDPSQTGPMAAIVVGLVMALTALGFAWIFLAILADYAVDLRPALWRARRALARYERRTLALWGCAALAALGLLAGAL